MKVILAKKYGFCMGVKRAVEKALEASKRDEKFTVLHQIVHNPSVSKKLKDSGVNSVEGIENVTTKGVIFSAHGVSPQVREEADKRDLVSVDATCPLVLKVHGIVKSYAMRGYEFIYIGHRGHPEPVGVMGVALGKVRLIESKEEVKDLSVSNPEKVVVVTQTTLSVEDTSETIEEIKKRYPNALVFNTICFETSDRQKALKEILPLVETVIVVGGKNSSNSKRLVDLARKNGRPSYLVETADDLEKEWLEGVSVVGLTAGASTPDSETMKVKEWIESI